MCQTKELSATENGVLFWEKKEKFLNLHKPNSFSLLTMIFFFCYLKGQKGSDIRLEMRNDLSSRVRAKGLNMDEAISETSTQIING